MYGVHLTPGRSSEKESTSKNVDGEVAVYKNRRKESIPVKVFNYLKMQMQVDGIPSKYSHFIMHADDTDFFRR